MSYWEGKKAVFNGDSITSGHLLAGLKEEAYPAVAARLLGLSCVKNYAISGATAAKKLGAYQETYLDLAAWEADMAAGKLDPTHIYFVRDGINALRPYHLYHFEDGTWRHGESTNVGVARTPLVDRIREMDKDADLVVIMIGTNDWYYNWTDFGSFEEGLYRNWDKMDPYHKESTFCGAMHSICRYLCETYRNKDVVLVTPLKRVQQTGVGRGEWTSLYPEDTNVWGKTLDDVRRTILKFGEYYSLPVWDCYAQSGLNPHIDPEMFSDTNGSHVHPGLAGHERMGSQLAAFLKTLRV